MTEEGLTQGHAVLMPLAVRIREACRLTGIGRSKLYELIAEGEIEIIKVGTITLIPVVSLERFLNRQLNGQFAPHGVGATSKVGFR